MNDREPISALKARVNLYALVEQWSGPGRQVGGTTTYRCPNPEHPDNSPSFTVSDTPKGQRWHCWSRCGAGDALDLVQLMEPTLKRGEAAAWLRRWLGEPDHSPAPRPVGSRKPAPPPSPPREAAPLPETEALPAAVAARYMTEYLAWRRWPAETSDLFGLEAVPGPHGWPAIRHPFHGIRPDGSVVVSTWQDRPCRYGKDYRGAKWIAAPGRPVPLWNLPALQADGITTAVVAEGPADGITAALALRDRPDVAVVAVPGAQAWQAAYADLVAGLRVVLVTDADEAGEQLAEAAIADLTDRAEVVLLAALPEGVNDLTEMCAATGIAGVAEHLAGYLPDPPPPPPRGLEEENTGAEPEAGDLVYLELFGEWVTRTPGSAASSTARHRPRQACQACGAPTSAGLLCTGCTTAEDAGPHHWRTCSACTRPALARSGRRCALTHGCEGRYTDRLALTTEEVAA